MTDTTTGPHELIGPSRYAGLAGDLRGIDDVRAPLVLLHGLTFNRAMWGPTLDELERMDPGRRVLTLDLPGHGQSSGRPAYDTDSEARAVYDAVLAAGLDAPVVVGHSAAGAMASIYAATYPTRGVVNVDSAPEPGLPFAGLLKSLEHRLTPESFPQVWRMFEESMQIDLLPPSARKLLRDNNTPDRALVVGRWQELLTRDAAELDEWLQTALRAVRESSVRYTLVLGSEPGPDLVGWLRQVIPGIDVLVWPGSGHFPHLARPLEFARLLATTASWPRATVAA
jgi:pimeloyl-ACP methyl ester carboxylesterase